MKNVCKTGQPSQPSQPTEQTTEQCAAEHPAPATAPMGYITANDRLYIDALNDFYRANTVPSAPAAAPPPQAAAQEQSKPETSPLRCLFAAAQQEPAEQEKAVEPCLICPAPATRRGMCAYHAHSIGLLHLYLNDSMIALAMHEDGAQRSARARNEAALAAEKPSPTKQSRELAKPHPWEAWSTAGDES